MARIRTIKPDFFTSETITSLPLRTRLNFIGEWTYVDDAGRGRDDPRLIKAAIWPLDDDVTVADIEDDQARLEADGLIERYQCDSRAYFRIRNWDEHQRISRPTGSRFPPSPEEGNSDATPRTTSPHESSLNAPRALTEDSPPEVERNREVEVEWIAPREPSATSTALTLHDTKPPAKPPAPRRRNVLWDALVEAVGVQPQTRSEQSNYGRVVKELNAIGATPDQVLQRATAWRRVYPNARLTVNVFAKHWSDLAQPVNGKAPASWATIAQALGTNR